MKLNKAMLDMTQVIRIITGKNEQTVNNEELVRVNLSAEKGNDFFNYYSINKIYFEIETCKLIDDLQNKFRDSHIDYSFQHTFGMAPSEMTYDKARNAGERVRTEIPKLMDKLEHDFRKILGVIDIN